jgi:hypothetical protein
MAPQLLEAGECLGSAHLACQPTADDYAGAPNATPTMHIDESLRIDMLGDGIENRDHRVRGFRDRQVLNREPQVHTWGKKVGVRFEFAFFREVDEDADTAVQKCLELDARVLTRLASWILPSEESVLFYPV